MQDSIFFDSNPRFYACLDYDDWSGFNVNPEIPPPEPSSEEVASWTSICIDPDHNEEPEDPIIAQYYPKLTRSAEETQWRDPEGRKALMERKNHPFPAYYEQFQLFERAKHRFDINPGDGSCQCCLRDPERPTSWSVGEIAEREFELGIRRPVDIRKGFVSDVWGKYGYQSQHCDCLKTAIERYNNYQSTKRTLQQLRKGKISHNFDYLSREWTVEDLTKISWDYHVHDTDEGTEIVAKPSTLPTHSETCHCLGSQHTEFDPPSHTPLEIMNDPEEEPEPEEVDAMEVIWSLAPSVDEDAGEAKDSDPSGQIDEVADDLI